jgi:tetratricopeptide (TPR) repeat protein
MDQAQRAARELEASGDPAAQVEGIATLGVFQFFYGASADGVASLRRAVELSRTRGEPSRFAARWLAVAATYGVTPVGEALDIMADLATDTAPGSAAEEPLLRLRGVLELRMGRNDEARAYLDRAAALSEKLGLMIVRSGADRSLAELEETLGNLDAAERYLRRGVSALEAMHDRSHGTSLASRLGGVLADLGRLEQARHFVDLGRAWITEGDVDGEGEWLLAETRLALAAGDLDAALAHADHGLEILRKSDYLSATAEQLLWRARVLEAAGRTKEAADTAQEGLEVAGRKEDLRLVRQAEDLLARLEG